MNKFSFRKGPKLKTKKFIYDLAYCFINYVVSYIPFWCIRKILYKICGLKLGINSRINMRVTLYSPWKIVIGNNTIVNERCLLDGRGGLCIGDNCSVSFNSFIYSASHYTSSNTFESFTKQTVIGNGVWLCVNSVILPGTKISDFCIIGAGSILSGQTTPKGIYIGNPAIYKKEREVNHISMNINYYFR